MVINLFIVNIFFIRQLLDSLSLPKEELLIQEMINNVKRKKNYTNTHKSCNFESSIDFDSLYSSFLISLTGSEKCRRQADRA